LLRTLRVTQRKDQKPLVDLGFASVTYGTGLQDPEHDERGRLRIAWDERVLPGGGVIKMPNPEGISGGAVWRFRRPARDALWSPSSIGRIIGVPVSYAERTHTEFAEPVDKWRMWFLRTLVDIDAAFPV